MDLRTEVQTVPPDEDVGHVDNAPVRRCGVQLRTSLAVKVVLYKERVQREPSVSAELSNTAHVYCDVMCNGDMFILCNRDKDMTKECYNEWIDTSNDICQK